MAAGYKDFTAGAILTAADLEDYNQNQSIMRFASAAARDTALSVVKTEGMFAYLIDVNTVTVYTGAAWSTMGPVHGALTSWTPVITQGATPTFTNNRSVYQRLGRWVWGSFVCTITGTPGTASNNVLITLPVTCVTQATLVHGVCKIADVSAATEFVAFLVYNTATNCLFQNMNAGVAPSYLGVTSFSAALATGDVLTGNFAFEAAADA